MAANLDLFYGGDLRLATADLGGFCGNPNSPQIELNGKLAASPAVSAHPLYLNCCEAAAFDVISAQLPTPIMVRWQRFVGPPPQWPVTVDLAKLPPGWIVSLTSGCLSSQRNCQPTDLYNEGFTGTLTIAQLNFGSYQMSTCLSVNESSPHPVIHSLHFWSPTISTQ